LRARGHGAIRRREPAQAAHRLAENTAVYDFELPPQDMAAIFALAQPGSRIVDPSGLAPAWD
jgi:diketogulonate reductase-like aldo/keto reductase